MKFNLSEKIFLEDDAETEGNFEKKDVKEFIKLFKEEASLRFGVLTARDMREMIDRLAGEKLI